MEDAKFRKLILRHWRQYGRHDLPWRLTTDPYHILVSEVMLQQTQVSRVTVKFRMFLVAFPTFRRLARAPIPKLLQTWRGLGYNRRALMLQRCAQAVMREYRGKLPTDADTLRSLPGIGPYTAGAIMAFAYNAPVPMIETNIRRVYLHHYFSGQHGISDKDILEVVERTLDTRNPRRWYWALMDYGAWIMEHETRGKNPNRRSRAYTLQSMFEGSDRQVRGNILKVLLTVNEDDTEHIAKTLEIAVERATRIFAKLERDGFVVRCRHARCVHNFHWSLSDS